MARPKNYAPGTQMLDLDALDEPEIIIKHNGKDHKLKQISVSDFVSRAKQMQDLALAPQKEGVEGEIDLVVTMLSESFPTFGKEEFMKLDLAKLYKIFDFANQFNGSKTGTEGEGKDPQLPAGDASEKSSEA